MKKFLILGCILAIFTRFSFAQVYSISDIYNETQTYISLIETKYKSQILRLEFDVTTGISATYRYLAKDQVYGIMAIGDKSKIENVDVRIYENRGGEWVEVAEDTQTKGLAVLNFTPSSSDTYKIEISATFKENEQYGFYSLIIFQ